MPEEVKRLSEFERATEITPEALLFSSIADVTSESGYSTRAATLSLVAECIAKYVQFASDLETTSKSLVGAINEVNEKGDGGIPAQTFNYIGQIIGGDGIDVEGYGTAQITIKDGIAQIVFSCKIERLVEKSGITWGVIRDYFSSAIGGRTITPTTGGTMQYFNSNGTLKAAQIEYGGIGNASANRWAIGRIYKNAQGQFVRGSWSNTSFAVGDIITGTLYGTVAQTTLMSMNLNLEDVDNEY